MQPQSEPQKPSLEIKLGAAASVWLLVGVPLERGLAVGLLDFVSGGLPTHAQDLVVAGEHRAGAAAAAGHTRWPSQRGRPSSAASAAVSGRRLGDRRLVGFGGWGGRLLLSLRRSAGLGFRGRRRRPRGFVDATGHFAPACAFVRTSARVARDTIYNGT